MTHTVKEQCHPLAIASIVIHTDFIPFYVCRSYHWGITTIPKNGMLGVTELSYYFWYDIHILPFLLIFGRANSSNNVDEFEGVLSNRSDMIALPLLCMHHGVIIATA